MPSFQIASVGLSCPAVASCLSCTAVSGPCSCPWIWQYHSADMANSEELTPGTTLLTRGKRSWIRVLLWRISPRKKTKNDPGAERKSATATPPGRGRRISMPLSSDCCTADWHDVEVPAGVGPAK